MNNIKRISVFTDASFKAETRIAGTGVVITNGNKRIIARKFRTHGVLGIAHAELIGVLNGFELLLDFIVREKYKGKIAISFFIDNAEVHRAIQKYCSKDDIDESNYDPFFKQTLLKIFSFMDDERFEIEYVFIGEKPRSYIKSILEQIFFLNLRKLLKNVLNGTKRSVIEEKRNPKEPRQKTTK